MRAGTLRPISGTSLVANRNAAVNLRMGFFLQLRKGVGRTARRCGDAANDAVRPKVIERKSFTT
jgi:hypothetical protein